MYICSLPLLRKDKFCQMVGLCNSSRHLIRHLRQRAHRLPSHVIETAAVRVNKMAAGPMWGSLPSIAILEILSYLSHEDRLKVSSVCKRWRSCLFHPSLWRKITFDMGYTKRQKSRFLADRCGRFVREAELSFNSHNTGEVRESSKILSVLCANKNLQYFSLQPSSCHIEWPDQATFIDR